MERHTSIRIAQFQCQCGHAYRLAIKLVRRRDSDEYEEFYRALNSDHWLPVPKCPAPDCLLAGDELSDALSTREFIQVPESERLYVWLSPDGQRVPVPGYRGAKMPERYRRAGYTPFEASNLRDLDRIDRIRAAQTGNTVYNEMNFSAGTRAARQRAEYSDDMTVDT